MGETLQLAAVCEEFVDCVNRTAPESADGEYFAIGTPAMRGNVIDLSAARRISAEAFERWTRRLVPIEGDLLLAREAPVGPVVRIPPGQKFAAGQRTTHLRANPAIVHPRYLFYLLISPDVQARLLTRAMGSTVPHLRVADLRALELPPLPPLAQQQQIADVLGALDDKIVANDRIVYLLHERNAALVARSSRECPVVRLDDVLTLNYGKALPAPSRKPGTVGVYGSGGLVGEHDSALINKPGVVVGRKGTVGSVYWADGPHYPIDTTYYVAPIGDASAEIMYYVLRSLRLAELNSDSAVPGLNRDEAYAQVVRVPSGNLVSPLNRALQDTFALLRSCRLETEHLARTRDELLPLLMSGKLRVKDAEAVASEVL